MIFDYEAKVIKIFFSNAVREKLLFSCNDVYVKIKYPM